MKNLEQIIGKELFKSRSENLFVFYSLAAPSNANPSSKIDSGGHSSMSFESISLYADSLNEQYGIKPPCTGTKTSEFPATIETFNGKEIIDLLNTPYKPSISEEEIAYANNLAQQYNAPSQSTETITPAHIATAQTFDPRQIIEAVNNPAYSSIPDKALDAFAYSAKPEIKTQSETHPYSRPLNFHGHAPQSFKIFEPVNTFQSSEHEKKYFEDFKKTHRIKISGLNKTEPVHNLFKKNEFPKVYNQVSKGMNLGKNAVKTITFTNPLKNKKDYSPSFRPWTRELKFPAIKPKMIPFDGLAQNDYNHMLNNAFLPHEMGHAKIEEEYSGYYPDVNIYGPQLEGFNEHLADNLSFDSVKNTHQLFRTRTERIKFEDKWVTPSDNNPLSQAEENYHKFLNSKKEPTLVPGKQATINMLGEPLLQQKYDHTLKNVLDFKYGEDLHKHLVYESINKLSNLYQESAVKLTDISKRNTIFSGFKAKKILTNVEKESFRFMENL